MTDGERRKHVDEYLTTDEVATLLRTPVETLRFWRQTGKGPASFKLGRRVLYAASDVAAFVDEAKAAGRA